MLTRESPVARFVVLVLLILALLLFGAKEVIDHLSERTRRNAELRSDARITADQLAASLALPVWNFDQPQLDKIMASVMQDRETEGVFVRVNDASTPGGVRIYGLQRDALSNAVPASQATGLSTTVSETRPILANGDPVGSVELQLTTRFMEADLRNHLIYQLITFIAFGAILGASLYLLLWRIVLRPLQIIERYAGEVSSGASARLSTGRFRGELERLRASIEKMVDLLAARFAVLQSSERQFRTFIEQAPVPIILVPSPDGAPIYFNPEFTHTFGYSREDISKPEDWWPQIYPDPAYRAARQAIWKNAVDRALTTGHYQDADEAEMTTQSGQKRHAYVRLAMINQYHMYYINDLTDIRQAEAALRLTQYAVDHNPLIIFRLGLDGRFVYANDAACTQFGYSPAELLQLHIWDVAQTVSADQWSMRAAGIREQRIVAMESVYLTKSGRTFPVEVRIQYVDFSGEGCFFTFADDITERKRAQEAEHAYTRRIQKLATELARSEERQRRELATILHDEVGQNLFAATTQLLTLRIHADGARGEVEKALSLLDQVTRDTRELTFELCPPALYQMGLVPALQRLADQFSARYHLVCTVAGSTAGPTDLNARGLAYQTVRELLNNTAKHANARNVTISATEAGQQVQIVVADDGNGFDPADLRLGRDGFGLFHLRERIELLGGTFTIDSAPKRGCRVQFTLPLSLFNLLQTVE